MSESVWDYPRPPRVEPTDRHLVVRHGGLIIAESRRSWRVLETSHPPVYYIPRADVLDGALSPSASGRRTFCEYKGVASYWDLTVDGHRLTDVAWSYDEPSDGYEVIAGSVALYASRVDECAVDGERVIPQASEFYGGWITSDIVGPFKG